MIKYVVDEHGFIIRSSASRSTRKSTQNRKYNNCPVCGVRVRVNNLDKHIRKVHPDYSADNSHTSQKSSFPVQQSRHNETAKSTAEKQVPLDNTLTQGGEKMTQCPYCSCRVRVDRLEKHIQKRCPVRRKESPQTDKRVSSNKRQNMHQVSVSNMHNGSNIEEEALRQSFDESIYGGKYLGHLRREFDGKFGSLPLYDDYGDESDAD